MTARPFATYTRAELLALYRDLPPATGDVAGSALGVRA